MRVIAGNLGGRVFDAPAGHRTHPMSERVRGAIFNTLGDITGMSVLDSYSGSGALGIEAVSRGAQWVEAVDVDKRAFETIRHNIAGLGLTDHMKVTRANIIGWSGHNADAEFDILFVDQPYDAVDAKDVDKLVRHIAKDGTLVVSWPGGTPAPEIVGVDLIKQKDFGDAVVFFYRKLA